MKAEREALRQKLAQDYDLKHFLVRVGEKEYPLACITNVDEVFDRLIEKGPEHPSFRDEQIPYWTELWPAALGLSEMIAAGKVCKKGQRVLELGCGLGLCGIVAADQGAEVILTDYLPEALLLARYNWLLNHDREADCRLLDWREPRPEWKIDLLIASDVAYEERAYQPLVNFFQSMIREGDIWLSEPGRNFTKSWIAKLPKEGFSMEKYLFLIEDENFKQQVGVYHLKPQN